MNKNFSEDEIEKILEQQQNNQNNEPNLEALLTNLIINPTRIKIKKTNLTDFNGNSIPIKQSSDGSTINPAGFPEETESEDVFLLDDGTSLCGITVCQTCGGVVKEDNLRRCKCGKTCCIIKGWGKHSKYRDEWYCSGLHKFLGELGFNLR